MNARWISNENAFLDVESGNPFRIPTPRMWPTDKPIPDGWEEVHFTTDSSFYGTVLVSDEKTDPCKCGDERRSHVSQRGKCLARKNAVNCDCLKFKEQDG